MDELYTVNLLEFQIVRQKLIWGWLSCRAGLLATMFIVATTRSHIIELVLDTLQYEKYSVYLALWSQIGTCSKLKYL